MTDIRTKHTPRKWSFVLVVASFIILFLLSATFPAIEWLFYDYRMLLTGHLFPTKVRKADHVVVIGIDGYKSLQDKPLIFWYPQIADCIQTAAGQGAAAIALDIIPYHSLAEKLDAVIRELGGTTQGEGLDNIGKDLDRSLISALIRSSAATPILQGYNGDIVPFYYGMMAHMPGAAPVSLLATFDEDGVLRQAYAADADGAPRLVAGVCDATGACSVDGSFLVDFRLADQIKTIDFDDFLHKKVPETEITGKIVLIGMINGNEDNVRTPVGLRNGIYFHAAAIETLLTGNKMLPISHWASALILFVLCLVGYLISSRRPPKTACLYLGLLTMVYVSVDLLLFSKNLVIPTFPHLFALGLTAAITYPYRYLVEERDRIKLKETFGYYVDKSVIDKLVQSDAKQLMEGEMRNVTVMSLDIRNFTSLSNSYPPETVVALLNHLFSKFTEVVQSNSGFVNKFIGDGMLAFFVGEDSPIMALDSAWSMNTLVQDMNEQKELFRFIQDRPIGIGIGLHYGPAIMGNIGSSRKMDFTVIGPTVNLAFRIESVTKELGATILVTREVYERTASLYELQHLGTVNVKGFSSQIEVYSPQQRLTG